MGLKGNFSNQSGKCKCTTAMFQEVDQKTIMSHTGHWSIQGVQKYKRPSRHQMDS